jgi:hypothetical protein
MHKICCVAAALILASPLSCWADPQTPVTPPAPAAMPSPDGLHMPQLAFTATPDDEAEYDKYFYFHRANTTFAQAWADIRECDDLASGNAGYSAGTVATPGMGILTGAIAGALAGALAAKIAGSAEYRKTHRINMRNCMGFKQYQRFGLSQSLWSKFNFEEGAGRRREDERNTDLALQALVASGPTPTAKELGL